MRANSFQSRFAGKIQRIGKQGVIQLVAGKSLPIEKQKRFSIQQNSRQPKLKMENRFGFGQNYIKQEQSFNQQSFQPLTFQINILNQQQKLEQESLVFSITDMKDLLQQGQKQPEKYKIKQKSQVLPQIRRKRRGSSLSDNQYQRRPTYQKPKKTRYKTPTPKRYINKYRYQNQLLQINQKVNHKLTQIQQNELCQAKNQRAKLYKIHTITDYRKIMKQSFKYGGLGPNVDKEFVSKWQRKMQKMQSFNYSVRSTNYTSFIEKKIQLRKY